MARDRFLVNEMLTELRTARSSIQSQSATIAYLLEKSNNALIQIEASRSSKTALNSDSSSYSYNKETVNALTRVIDKFMNLLNSNDSQLESSNLEEYLRASNERADYLGCNIRKLLAIWDTTQQMRVALRRREAETYNDAASESEEDCF